MDLVAGDNSLTVQTKDIHGNFAGTAVSAIIRSQAYLVRPEKIVVDLKNQRALVTDRNLGAVIAVDLKDGVRTLISGANIPNNENRLRSPTGIALSRDGEHALVVDDDRVVEVDLRDGSTRGARTILSGPTVPNEENPLRIPTAIAVTADGKRALVVDKELKAVITVDLEEGPMRGTREIVSSSTVPDDKNPLLRPTDITLAADDSKALVLDAGNDVVVAIDLDPGPMRGMRTILWNPSGSGEENPFGLASGFAFLANENRGLVVDSFREALVVDLALEAVISIDLAQGPSQGRRSILSSPTIPDRENRLDVPTDIAVTVDGKRALVVDERLHAVLSIDLATGKRTILSSPTVPDDENPLGCPTGIAVMRNGNRALVVDKQIDELIAIDLVEGPTLGRRTILPNPTLAKDTMFVFAQDIVVTPDDSRALVVDRFLDAVIAIDLEEGPTFGARTVVSDRLTPNRDTPFLSPLSIVLDPANERALVMDVRRLFAVDLREGPTYGVRTILSNVDLSDGESPLVAPFGMVLDPVNQWILATEPVLHALTVFDPVSGQNVILSR